MIKSRIIDVLKSFTPLELKRFETFVKSEYFNTNKSTVVLIGILARYYPEFSDQRLTKEKIFKVIYGDRTYNDGDIRKLLFDLYHLSEKFIINERIANERTTGLNILLEELLNRNLVSQYIKAEKEFETAFEKLEAFNDDILLELYKFEKTRFNFADKNQYIKTTTGAIGQINTLNRSNEYLFIYLIRHFVTCFINKKIQKSKYAFEDLPDFTGYILQSMDLSQIEHYFKRSNKFSYLFELYQISYKLFNEFERTENYSKLKLLYRKYRRNLGKSEKNYFSTICISYCIMNEKQGVKDGYFENELFDLYKEYLQDKLYLVSGEKYCFIPLLLFYAILTNGINLGKFEWVLNFVRAFSNELAPMHRENMRNFGLAICYSRTNNYTDALSFANKINFSNFIFKYELRNLMLRIYTEMDYYSEALSLIHSYKQFIKSDILLNRKEKQFNSKFIYYVEKLIKCKEGNKKLILENILILVHKDVKFHSKKWVLRKYEEEIYKNSSPYKNRKTV